MRAHYKTRASAILVTFQLPRVDREHLRSTSAVFIAFLTNLPRVW